MDERHEQRVERERERERERGRGGRRTERSHNASVYHDDVQRHVCKKGDLSDRRREEKEFLQVSVQRSSAPSHAVLPTTPTRRCRERINPRTTPSLIR